MKYLTYLKNLKVCPFCEDIKGKILLENDGAYLTYSLAPYHKYHLLVIPKRHVENLAELTWEEHVCLTALFVTGVKTLGKLGHNDCTLLTRDSGSLGKSIKHLHGHIIPGGFIQDTSLNTAVRKILSTDEEKNLKKELKKISKL